MHPDFQPIVKNPHLLTIAGNFWPRKIDERRFPSTRQEYTIDDRTTILALEHQPELPVRGEIIFIHGLEGCAGAGYIASFSQHALERGFMVHRVNLRTCGGTEALCQSTYHSGLTSDTRVILERIYESRHNPIFLVGFSLGGNVALKLAGELHETNLIRGVCAVSTPIDLAACSRALNKPSNRLYARRFLKRLQDRVRRKSRLSPDLYRTEGLDQVSSIWEFDDRFTTQLFGFGNAANYYATQSAAQFLDAIRVPALVICSKDDPLVPFEVYDHRAFRTNPFLRLLATDHGGHLGFLSRRKPRFWVDRVALNWMDEVLANDQRQGTDALHLTSV